MIAVGTAVGGSSPADACPEDAVRPALVEQDERRDDQRHDASSP